MFYVWNEYIVCYTVIDFTALLLKKDEAFRKGDKIGRKDRIWLLSEKYVCRRCKAGGIYEKWTEWKDMACSDGRVGYEHHTLSIYILAAI